MKWSCQDIASTKKMGLFGGAAGVAHPQHVACHVMSEVVLQVSCSRCCVMLLHDENKQTTIPR